MPHRTAFQRHLRTLLFAAGATIALACLTGCYERVISAKGLGSDRIETQQPYQEDSEVDRWLYGPPRRQALIRVLDVDPPASAYHARSIQEHAWASKPLFPRTRFSPRSCST